MFNNVLATLDIVGSLFDQNITEEQLSHLSRICPELKDMGMDLQHKFNVESVSQELIQFAMGIQSGYTDERHLLHPFAIICSPILSKLLVSSKDPKLMIPYLCADPNNPLTNALVRNKKRTQYISYLKEELHLTFSLSIFPNCVQSLQLPR